jgi:Fis family transcriptional regulator, factor for inversion stimulation protein
MGLWVQHWGLRKRDDMYDFEPDPRAAEALVGMPVADVERDLILATLRQTEGNRTHAAHVLGISIRTMRNKLREYADQGLDIEAAASPLT